MAFDVIGPGGDELFEVGGGSSGVARAEEDEPHGVVVVGIIGSDGERFLERSAGFEREVHFARDHGEQVMDAGVAGLEIAGMGEIAESAFFVVAEIGEAREFE